MHGERERYRTVGDGQGVGRGVATLERLRGQANETS